MGRGWGLSAWALPVLVMCALLAGAWGRSGGTGSCPAPDEGHGSALALMRQVVAVQKVQDQAQPQFAWRERDISQEWDHGKVAHTEDRTWDVSLVHGEEYRRLIARDGKPLTPEEERKQEQKLEQFIREHEPHSVADRAKIEQKLQKEQEKDERRDQAVLQGFQFTLKGSEPTEWGEAWVLHAVARQDFHPSDKALKIMTHFTGDLWIEQQGCHLMRLDLQVVKPISFGWILGKLYDGGTVSLQFGPVAKEYWFIRNVRMAGSARVLFKHLAVTADQSYSDYRRFQVRSRMLPATPLAASSSGRP